MDLRRELEGVHRASFGWALACCRGHRSDAEDVLQATYLKVLEGRARFAGRSSFQTWLFSVIHRTAGEVRRRRGVRARWLERWRAAAWHEGEQASDSPYAAAEASSRPLLQALALLARRQQEVLHLVFYQDLTIEEAADVLGISLGSARTHFERGKARLRERLRQAGER